MTTFSVRFVNQTSSVWSLLLTATLASGGGLQSVVFQQTRAPSSGTTSLQFEDTLCIALGTYRGTGSSRVYDTTLTQPAAMGTAWKVVSQSGVQVFVADGNAPFPDQVRVLNASAGLANIGIGVETYAAVYQPDVLVNTAVPFVLPLTYWATLSSDAVATGTVMSTSAPPLTLAVVTNPVKLTLSAATPSATVTATDTGGVLTVTVTYP